MKVQEAFNKVESLRSQFPNESDNDLIKRAGVTKMAFYRGRKLASGNKTKRNPTVQAATAKRKGRPPGKATTGTTLKNIANKATTLLGNNQLIALVGSPAQIRDFLSTGTVFA